MRKMTLAELLMKEDDATLLNIHDELESGIIPATSYAHEYCRKVNRMINEGRLCVVPGKYRTVYLPTVSKMVYQEMARRYAMQCYSAKTITANAYAGPTVKVTPLERTDDDELHTCEWCRCDDFDRSDLHTTDLGMLCDSCIDGIRSRGDIVCVYD